MNFYANVTNAIVEKIRDYNDFDSSTYGEDYQYGSYDSIDSLIEDFKRRNNEDKEILYENYDVRMADFKDYVQEFVDMYTSDFLPLDGWMLHYIFEDDGASYSLYLKKWIFLDCCDKAKEILRNEFNNYDKDIEIESEEEDYDEGFGELD